MDAATALHTSSTAVLNTPELLDIVLHYCTAHDLLRLQCVSKRFAYHIHGSKSLKARLFLDPDINTVVVNDNQADKTEMQGQESIIKPDTFLEVLFQSPTDRQGHNANGELVHEKWSICEQMTRWSDNHFVLLHLPRDLESTPSKYGCGASWRKMTFTQPPVYAVGVFMGSPRHQGDTQPRTPDYQFLSNDRGVQLGEIFDNIQQRAKTPWLRHAPIAVAVLRLASYERTYSACYHAFIRYRGPPR